MTNMDMSREAKPTKRARLICAFAFAYALDLLDEYNEEALARCGADSTKRAQILCTRALHVALLRDVYGYHLKFDDAGHISVPLPGKGMRGLLGEAASFARLMI